MQENDGKNYEKNGWKSYKCNNLKFRYELKRFQIALVLALKVRASEDLVLL